MPRTYWREAVYSTDKPVLYVVRPALGRRRRRTWCATGPDTEMAVFTDAGHALFVDDAGAVQRADGRLPDPDRLAVRLAVWRRCTLPGPLFLVSLAAVGYEIALTRYFAVAKWSEYGYWVISIVMVGLRAERRDRWRCARDAFARRARSCWPALPALLVAGGRGRLPLHHDQSVQPAAIAEPGDLAAADLEHRRLLRRAAAVLLPGRPLHQPELRAATPTGSAGSMAST